MKNSLKIVRKSFESQDLDGPSQQYEQISTQLNSIEYDEESKFSSLKFNENKYAVSDDYDSDDKVKKKELKQNLLSNKNKSQEQQKQNIQIQDRIFQQNDNIQYQYVGLNSPQISINRNQFNLNYNDRYHAQSYYNSQDQYNEYNIYGQNTTDDNSIENFEQQEQSEDNISSQYSINFAEHEVWPAFVNCLYASIISLLVTYLLGAGIILGIFAMLGDSTEQV